MYSILELEGGRLTLRDGCQTPASSILLASARLVASFASSKVDNPVSFTALSRRLVLFESGRDALADCPLQ